MIRPAPRRGPRGPCLAALVLLIATGAPGTAAAQNEPLRVWLGAGFGVGASQVLDGSAFMAQLVVQKGSHHFALRTAVVYDLYGGDGGGELGLLYGRTLSGPAGHVAAAAGVAITGIDWCHQGALHGCGSFGMPFVVEAAFSPVPLLGLGIQAFANLNESASYVGFALFLQLGWMP